MNNTLNIIKIGIAATGGAISTVIGGWDMGIKVLVLFIVLDYITGLLSAYILRKLNSSVGFKGIFKKILLFIPVMLAYALDNLLGSDILRNLAIWFYIANEGLSVLENLGKAGIPFPAQLTEALEQLRKE